MTITHNKVIYTQDTETFADHNNPPISRANYEAWLMCTVFCILAVRPVVKDSCVGHLIVDDLKLRAHHAQQTTHLIGYDTFKV